MGKKLEIEEIVNNIYNVNPNILILSNENISGEKLKCRCLIDGYEWEALYSNLKKGHGCRICANKKLSIRFKFTLDEIKEKLKEKLPNVELLSDEYINANTNLTFRCSIDGYIWSTTWGAIYSGTGCPKCNNCVSPSIAEIKEYIYKSNPNIEILSDEHIRSDTKLKVLCKIHNTIFYSLWGGLKRGVGCPKCGNVYKSTIEEIKDEILKLDKKIILLSNSYENVKEKLLFLCMKCKNEWLASWDSVRRGTGCPKCASEFKKRYTLKYAERNKDALLKENGIIYIILCSKEDENFYKIGITKKSVKNRFVGKEKMPYNYKIICEINTNLYNAIIIENTLHELNKDYKYTPKIKFGGYSECFSSIVIESVDILNNQVNVVEYSGFN